MRTGTTAADIVRIIILICIMFRTGKVLSFNDTWAEARNSFYRPAEIV